MTIFRCLTLFFAFTSLSFAGTEKWDFSFDPDAFNEIGWVGGKRQDSLSATTIVLDKYGFYESLDQASRESHIRQRVDDEIHLLHSNPEFGPSQAELSALINDARTLNRLIDVVGESKGLMFTLSFSVSRGKRDSGYITMKAVENVKKARGLLFQALLSLEALGRSGGPEWMLSEVRENVAGVAEALSNDSSEAQAEALMNQEIIVRVR